MRHISGKMPGYFVFFITFFAGVSGLCRACFGHGLFRFCFGGVYAALYASPICFLLRCNIHAAMQQWSIVN